MKFDELNQLKRFFSVMEIPQKEKDKRTSLGMFFFDVFFYVFVLMRTEIKVNGKIDKDFYIKTLDGRIRDVLDENNIPYDDVYIPQLTKDVIDATERHLDDPYYFSKERALIVAQNESNTVYNNIDYQSAKNQGKKYKTWIAIEDEKTREAHTIVDKTRIPIDEMFKVGNDEMRFPHDYINGSPENLINFRCSCLYS